MVTTNVPAEILKKPYARILIPSGDGSFTAEVLEFPGCITEGNTADEALARLERTATAWIETMQERGRDIPEPCNGYDYSGRIALRLPRSLHRQAARMAERDGTSLNQYLVDAIASLTGATDMFHRMISKVKHSHNIWVTVTAVTNVQQGIETTASGSIPSGTPNLSLLTTTASTTAIGPATSFGGFQHG